MKTIPGPVHGPVHGPVYGSAASTLLAPAVPLIVAGLTSLAFLGKMLFGHHSPIPGGEILVVLLAVPAVLAGHWLEPRILGTSSYAKACLCVVGALILWVASVTAALASGSTLALSLATLFAFVLVSFATRAEKRNL